jgi:hypothetical protein
MNIPNKPEAPASVALERVVVLPAVKEQTTGDDKTDRLFEEAVEVALARAKPVIVEFLKQEVLRRMDHA